MSTINDPQVRFGVSRVSSENGQAAVVYPPAYMKNQQSSSASKELERAEEKWRNLTRQFGREIFSERKFSDVILGASNGDVIAHKVILAVNSTVLKALFLLLDVHKTEKGDGSGLDRIELADFSKEEVETFLEILYTGESPRLPGHIRAVFLLARTYQVLDLLALAEAGLYSSMKADNAVDLFLLAEEEQDTQLAKAVVQFIVKPVNKKAVMASDKWQSLRSDHPLTFVKLLELIVAAI